MSRMTAMNDNSRKSATKLLLVNWSRFSNECINLKGSTLFTGVNGSGKSTILDAMTYMLTGNTQFNKAALDRDRNVISYVRGDTKSEGKNRFIREGEIVSYIAMEFWSPIEKQYLVVGVCIEYVNETSNTKKWFVFKDTKIEDCIFYNKENTKIMVFPHHNLMVKGKKVSTGEFMNRDKGTEQVLRALGLRCGVDRYKAKLVKMMAFNPENNIDKFIQECVLDEHSIHSLEDIREHRQRYSEAKNVYEELANSKKQLEVIQQKIEEYEETEKKYEIRRILLLYQQIRCFQENQDRLEQNININIIKYKQLRSELEELETKRKRALERKTKADNNSTLCDVNEIIKMAKDKIEALENEIKKYKECLNDINKLEVKLQDILEWIEIEISDKGRAIISNIASTSFSYDEKIQSFIHFKTMVNNVWEKLNKDRIHTEDRIKEIDTESERLQEKINGLKNDVLPFEKRYEDAKRIIKEELSNMNIQTDVRLFAELVKSIDKEWQLAVETFLGNKRFDIIVDGKYCKEVMKIVHRNQLRGIKVVITDKLPLTDIQKNSAATVLDIPNEYGRKYANYILNGIHLCEDIKELHEYPKGGLMKDGTLAKSYTMACMNMEKTQFYMGKDAVKQQLEYTQNQMILLQKESNRLNGILKTLKGHIDEIESVNWDEQKYYFDVQKQIDASQKEIQNEKTHLKEIESNPDFAAALEESDKADKEYKEIDRIYVSTNSSIDMCENRIKDDKQRKENVKNEIEKAEKEYNDAILMRLELRSSVIELYEKLHIKSDSARVMKENSVERARSDKDNAARHLEDEQRRYWRIVGQSDEKYGVGYISFFRELYKDIANVKIEEAKQKLEEQQYTLENAFMVDFVAELNEAISKAKTEIDVINEELKNIPFGKDTYEFKMDEKTERSGFFNLCKKLEGYMNSIDLYRSMNPNDEEMEYNIRQFMDMVLEEENEEEYTDYRKYFKYNMKIKSRQGDDEITYELSKKQGSASNGEKQTPYFIILAASLMQCYPRNVSCARLAFIDEAFSALSRERIEQMVKFLEDNKFQVIYAAPPEKIDSIGSYINSTVSLCLKGKFTYAIEGLVKNDNF